MMCSVVSSIACLGIVQYSASTLLSLLTYRLPRLGFLNVSRRRVNSRDYYMRFEMKHWIIVC